MLSPNATAASEALHWSLRGPPGRVVPDALILCSSLWHMLHVGDPGQYGQRIAALRAAVVELQDAVAAAAGGAGGGGDGDGVAFGMGANTVVENVTEAGAGEPPPQRRRQLDDPLVARRPSVYW